MSPPQILLFQAAISASSCASIEATGRGRDILDERMPACPKWESDVNQVTALGGLRDIGERVPAGASRRRCRPSGQAAFAYAEEGGHGGERRRSARPRQARILGTVDDPLAGYGKPRDRHAHQVYRTFSFRLRGVEPNGLVAP